MTDATTFIADHPGSFIKDELTARSWSQRDLAFVLGIPEQSLTQIISAKRGISPEMAKALAEAFGVSPTFFANLQQAYDLSRARDPDIAMRQRARWQNKFPLREMIRRGWIDDSDPMLLEPQLLRFFNVNDLDVLDKLATGDVIPAHAARKTNALAPLTSTQLAWLQRVRHVGETVPAPRYDPGALRSALPEIRNSLIDTDEVAQIPSILMDCGVRFVLVEALPSSKIDGVCLWLDEQPVIGMTILHDRLDNFAFVLRHEIEHILRQHGIDDNHAPIDHFDDQDIFSVEDLAEDERIANCAALEFCVPQDSLSSFIARKFPYISERDVLGFAARMEVHPALVIGQIQKRTERWNWLRKYLVRVRGSFEKWDFVDGWGLAASIRL